MHTGFSRVCEFIWRVARKIKRTLLVHAVSPIHYYDELIYQRQKLNGSTLAVECGNLSLWSRHEKSKSVVLRWAVDVRRKLISQADAIQAHQFKILGSNNYAFGEHIDWHLDFKSGYRWDEKIHYTKIRRDILPKGVDIKVPWELSRCMHFSTLGLADLASDEIKYYESFKSQVDHWIESNVLGYGVNWACPMDCGIRAVNWINALMLFSHRVKVDDDSVFFSRIAKSLWMHGLHIRRNLEWRSPWAPSSGNHFLADIVGLLAVGGFFRKNRTGNKWWKFAHKWIAKEMERQVLDDGCHFEGSTSYHRLVMEMFLWADSIATRAGEPFSDSFKKKLNSMAQFCASYTFPSGHAAQFGDNDNGRLLWAGLDQGVDHRYLTDGKCSLDVLPNRLLLRGTLDMPPTMPAKAFKLGGYYFLANSHIWTGLKAGKVFSNGCHTHCDQLSLVLSLGEQEILVDRGTGCYTPDLATRNHYRATAAHNTLQVNGQEQNGFQTDRSSAFSMPDHTQAEVTHWKPETGTWIAKHYGFERIKEGMIHTREVKINDHVVQITDSIGEVSASDELKWNFHFAPGLILTLENDSILVQLNYKTLIISWPFECEAVLKDCFHSPSYGKEIPAQSLYLKCKADAGRRYKIFIKWQERFPNENR